MISVNVAEFARQNPDVALQVFQDTERAVQELLPGSDYHPRYEGVDAVGLATLIAPSDTLADGLNPTRPGALKYPVFMADNSASQPQVWLPLEKDGGMLGGGPHPETSGRFIAFALAKANRLAIFRHETRSYDEKLTPAPGVVGFAGARRVSDAIVSTSGLLEVHDDLVTLAQAGELIRYAQDGDYETNVDQFTARIFMALTNLSTKFPEVANITPENRRGLGKMLIANQIFFDLDRDFTTAN